MMNWNVDQDNGCEGPGAPVDTSQTITISPQEPKIHLGPMSSVSNTKLPKTPSLCHRGNETNAATSLLQSIKMPSQI